MAMTSRPGESFGGGAVPLGSPVSRARFAVSQNEKALAEQARNARNTEIKTKAQEILKSKQGTQAGHTITNSSNNTRTVK